MSNNDSQHSELDQFIEEAENMPSFEIADKYITGGSAVTDDGESVPITKEILTIMLNKSTKDITDDERHLVSSVFDKLSADSGFISIEYDMNLFKEDIIEFTDKLITKHFPK